MMICPNDSTHDEFTTTAHEQHDWIVDGNGEFKADLGCIGISANPDTDNIWTCRICSAQAVKENNHAT